MPAEAVATPLSSVSALQQRIDELNVELHARTAERDEAMQHDRALAEVLEAINTSAQVPTEVFDMILEKAMRLCAAAFGYLMTYDGERFQVVASHSLPAGFAEYLRNIDQPGSTGLYAAIRRGSAYDQVADLREGEVYRTSPLRRALVDLGGARTGIVVALRKDDSLLGVITIYRQEVRPFARAEIALLQNFAAQAVIAIDTSRLLGELRESEARHALVSDAVAEGIYEWNIETNALWVSQRLIEIFGFEGRELKAADWNELVHPEDFLRYRSALRDCFKGIVRRLDCEYRVRHADGAYRWIEDRAVTVRNAAGQAVRLVGAVADVTARKESEYALHEALERQTATAEVLQVINVSPGNLEPVFTAMLEKALRLCQAAFGVFWTYDGGHFHASALLGVPKAFADFATQSPHRVGNDNTHARALHGETVMHIVDAAASEAYRVGDPLRRALVDLGGARTSLGVALRKDGVLFGVLVVYRKEVRPFTDRQVGLMEDFAAQAVIAMENARLLGELRARTADLQESLEYQTAISDVIQVISRSTFDLAPVLQTLTESAIRLCEADMGFICRREGDVYRVVAAAGSTSEFARNASDYQQYQHDHPLVADRGSLTGRVVLEKGPVQIADVTADPEYLLTQASALGGIRSQVGVPLMREGALIGVIILSRQRVKPFTSRQIELLQVFADQAVIAIENTRLLTEQREALDQQTATAEVLEVINSSPGNLGPVFAAILEKAMHVCGASFGGLWTFQGDRYVVAALHNVPDAYADFLRVATMIPGAGSAPYRFLHGERSAIQNIDLAEEELYRSGDPQRRALVDLGGARTALQVPLCKDDTAIGVVTIYRKEVLPFDERQIALLQNFAAQAVIAIENSRLLNELRDRSDDLQESLEYLTATSEVLNVISRSTTDLQPVLDAMVASAIRLCSGQTGGIAVKRGDKLHFLASVGHTPQFEQHLRDNPFSIDRSTSTARAVMDKDVVHIVDIEADPEYAHPEASTLGQLHTILSVPLMREGEAVGVITVSRSSRQAFTERQVALIKTFADQAVIAMENTRLLGELRESLEQQTATSDVLKTISRSSVGLEAVLHTLVKTVAGLCRADQSYMFRHEGGLHHLVASHGLSDSGIEYFREHPFEPTERTVGGRVIMRRQTVHIADVLQEQDYGYRGGQQVAGYRTLLGIPLMAQDNMVGVFIVTRTRVDPFTDKEIALASGFADQAVIAVENARLFEELRERQNELRVTFDNMGDGVVMFDDELRLVAWNKNFQELLDVPDSFLVGRPTYQDYIRLLVDRGEFGTTDLETELSRRRADFARQWSVERTRPDGRVLEVRNNPVPGGGAVLIYGDITERKKAEAEIAAARDAAEAALERQTATADILKVIASSPTDVQPVLDAVVKAALPFCGAADAVIILRDGDGAIFAAHEGPFIVAPGSSFPLNRETSPGLAILDGRTTHFPDIASLDPVEFAAAHRIAAAQGFRAAVAAPLLREGTAIGSVALRKPEPGPFAPQQIALLETFAAQAVIAIENVRLFTELKESLDQQTATAEVLRVISQSPSDVSPVLNAVAKAAMRFCGAEDTTISLRDGTELTLAAHEGPIGSEEVGRRYPLDEATIRGRAVIDGRTLHLPDVAAPEGALYGRTQELAKEMNFRAVLAAPMLRDDTAIGSIALRRAEPGAFTPRQIELLEAFAAQAVIAIENVRLFTELRESLDQQTATAEILRAISQSPTDVQPVLDAVAKAAVRFCGAPDAVVILREGDEAVVAAHEGILTASVGLRRPFAIGNLGSTAMQEGRTFQVADVASLDPAVHAPTLALARQHKWRASATAPMMREGEAIGCIVLRKPELGLLLPRQVELLETFAAQAVIAIENVRLFTELKESLEQQTATSEILRAISQSPTDVQPVLKAVVGAARRFCGADDAMVVLREETEQLLATHEGSLQSLVGTRLPLDRSSATGRATIDGQTFHVPDVASLDPAEHAMTIELTRRTGIRSLLAAPMLREGQAIGCVLLRRPTPGAFTPRQIELLEAFAAQAVIAIENVRLFTELRDSLERLKAAQANLIQSEKMASLGQLTAGIAHEIKNPLNFINNFAGLSSELVDELKQAVDVLLAEPDENKRAELQDTMDLLTGNLSKIVEHGRRADGIVKSMLSHSRGGTGDWQEANINALVEEALNLAYHGARAQDNEFNVTLERDFDPEPKPIELVPQDVTRVFLNLFGNGFYAANKRRLGNVAGYRPSLKVSTRDLGDAVEIRVRDNGTGIPPEVRDKLFQPFFTTKPTGEGTGLGLSISYDIVSQQHGGSIDVESEPGAFTEFTVRLPRRRRAA